MTTAYVQRTQDRMDRFVAFLHDLRAAGLDQEVPPYWLPIQRIADCPTLDGQWDIADAWLNAVRDQTITDELTQKMPPLVDTLKKRVTGWRQVERV